MRTPETKSKRAGGSEKVLLKDKGFVTCIEIDTCQSLNKGVYRDGVAYANLMSFV